MDNKSIPECHNNLLRVLKIKIKENNLLIINENQADEKKNSENWKFLKLNTDIRYLAIFN